VKSCGDATAVSKWLARPSPSSARPSSQVGAYRENGLDEPRSRPSSALASGRPAFASPISRGEGREGSAVSTRVFRTRGASRRSGKRSLVCGSFHATAGRRQRSLGRVTIPSVAVRLSHTRRLPSCDMNQIERDPANTGRTPAARLWPGGGSGMASYRIICDNQAPVGAPKKHAHVVEVGVGTTAANWNRLLTLSQVLGMMARGDTWRMPAGHRSRS
jgi:hypothetical protein